MFNLNSFAIFLFTIFVDIAMPTMALMFRTEKIISSDDLKIISKKYKLLSFPRSVFLMSCALFVIFAPKDAANNVIYMTVLVALWAIYVLFAILDMAKACKAIK